MMPLFFWFNSPWRATAGHSLCKECPLRTFAGETILNLQMLSGEVERVLQRAQKLLGELSPDDDSI